MVELIPPVAVRLRRDVGQVIRAIKAHALLHRDQRKRDDSGEIVADIDLDYDAVRRLMNAIVAEGSGVAVNPAMVETVEAVTKATIGMADGEGASAKDIAKLLKLDKSAARRRLITACTEDLIVNLESRRGMPGKYRTTGQKIEPMAILPATADLAKGYSAKFADTSPEPVPPCHREEIPQSILIENGGKPGGKPVAGGDGRWHGWQPVANGFATDKSLEPDANSPPVAWWHGFSGETEEKRYLTPANDASPQVGDACTDKPLPGEFRCDIVDVPDGDHLTTLPCAQCGAGRPDDPPAGGGDGKQRRDRLRP
jgi:hypothetical protein